MHNIWRGRIKMRGRMNDDYVHVAKFVSAGQFSFSMGEVYCDQWHYHPCTSLGRRPYQAEIITSTANERFLKDDNLLLTFQGTPTSITKSSATNSFRFKPNPLFKPPQSSQRTSFHSGSCDSPSPVIWLTVSHHPSPVHLCSPPPRPRPPHLTQTF